MVPVPTVARRSWLEKVLSSVLSVALLLEPSFLAVAQSSFPLEGAMPVLLPSALQKNLGLPLGVGTVQKVVVSEKTANGGIVFYIQDAHCNPVAQANIARIVETLVKEEGVRLVCVEGAKGRVDVSAVLQAGTEEKRQQVAEEFAERGLLTGVEILQITRDLDLDVQGVENKQAYLENFSALQETLATLKENEGFLQKSQTLIGKLKEKTFPEPLQKFDEAFQSYLEKSSDRRDFVLTMGAVLDAQKSSPAAQAFLKGFDAPESYPNFKLLLKTARQEQSLDFSKLEKEQARFWSLLKAKVSSQSFKAWEKKSAACREGSIAKEEFYTEIVSEIGSKPEYSQGEGFPGLLQYAELLQTFAKVEKQELLGEVRELAFDVEKVLAGDGKALAVVGLAQRFRILDRLLHLKFTRSELRFYQDHRDEFVSDAVMNDLNRIAKDNGLSPSRNLEKDRFALDVGIPSADAYYRYLLRRDQFLVQNVFQAMRESGQQKAVLVAGGFHSQGICDYVREKNAGIVVLSPVVGEPTDLYYQVMMDPRRGLDAALASLESGLAPVLLFDRGLGLNSAALLEQMVSALQNKSMAVPSLDRAVDRLQLETLTVEQKKQLLRQLRDAKVRVARLENSKDTVDFLTRLHDRVDDKRYASLEKEARDLKGASQDVAALALLKEALDDRIARNQWHEAHDLYTQFKTSGLDLSAYLYLDAKIQQFEQAARDLNALKLSEGNLNLINTGGHYHVAFPWKGKQIDVNVPGDGSCFFHAAAWGEIINQKTVPATIQTLDQLDQWLRTTVAENEALVNVRVLEMRAQIAERMNAKYLANRNRILDAIALEIGAMRQDNLRSARAPDQWLLSGGLGGDNAYSQAYTKFFKDNNANPLLTFSAQGFNRAALEQMFDGKSQELDKWAKDYLAALASTNMWAGTLEETVLREIRTEQAVPLASIDVHNLHFGVHGDNLVQRNISTLLWEGRYSSREQWRSEDLSSSLSVQSSSRGQLSTETPQLPYKPVLTDDRLVREEFERLHPQPGKKRIADQSEILAANKKQIQDRDAIRSKSSSEVAAHLRSHPELDATLEQAVHPRYGSLNKDVDLFRQIISVQHAEILTFFQSKGVESFNALTAQEGLPSSVLKSLSSQNALTYQLPVLLELVKSTTGDERVITERLNALTIPQIQEFYSIMLGSLLKGQPVSAKEQKTLQTLGFPADLALKGSVNAKALPKQILDTLLQANPAIAGLRTALIMEGVKSFYNTSEKALRDPRTIQSQKEAIVTDQKALKAILLDWKKPSSASLEEQRIAAETQELLRRVQRHNWLKADVRANFQAELNQESVARSELLQKMVAAIASKKDIGPQLDYSKIAELLSEERKGKSKDLQKAVSAVLQASLREIQDQIQAPTREESEKLLKSKNLTGKALALINAAISLNQGYPTLTEEQLMTALGAYQGGQVMELATGEGKTAVSMAAGFLNSLAGKPSLIVTTKESSAADTHREAKEAFELLGLSIGLVKQKEDKFGDNRKAYRANITVVATSQMHFDLLGDLLTGREGDPAKRQVKDLSQAAMVVDEFDSVMIHQALTEYISSGDIHPEGEKLTDRDLIQPLLDFGKSYFTPSWIKNLGEKNMTRRQTKYLLAYAVLRQYGPNADKSEAIQEKSWSDFKTWKDFGIRQGAKGLEMSPETLDLFLSKIPPSLRQFLGDDETWKHYLLGQIEAFALQQREETYDIYKVKTGINPRTGQPIIEEKLFLIDYSTGVFLPSQRRHGEVGGGGGHMALEVKEKLDLKEDSQTSAALSPREVMLSMGKVSGITGTAEATQESVSQIYGLGYRHIPTHNPILRKDVGLLGQELSSPDQVLPVFRTDKERTAYLAKSIVKDVKEGRPILVFANTVEDSKIIARDLSLAIAAYLQNEDLDGSAQRAFIQMGLITAQDALAKNFAPKLLGYNAHEGQSRDREMEIVEEQAGQPGAITIVTNIGGRGTDFKLHGMAAEKGFHNYGMSPSEGSDIEAQRRGRAGRQGAMGTSEELVSLESDMEFMSKSSAPETATEYAKLLEALKNADASKPLSPELQRRVWQQMLVAQDQIKRGKEKQIIDRTRLGEAKFQAQIRFAKYRREAMDKLEKQFDTMAIPEAFHKEMQQFFEDNLSSSDRIRLKKGEITLDQAKFHRQHLNDLLKTRYSSYFPEIHTVDDLIKTSGGDITLKDAMKAAERNVFTRLTKQKMQNIMDGVQGDWFDSIQEQQKQGKTQDEIARAIDPVKWQETLQTALNRGLGNSALLDSILKEMHMKDMDKLIDKLEKQDFHSQIHKAQNVSANLTTSIRDLQEEAEALLAAFSRLQDPASRAALQKRAELIRNQMDSLRNMLWFSETLGLVQNQPSVRQAVFRAAANLSSRDLEAMLKNQAFVASLGQNNWLAEVTALFEAKLGRTLDSAEDKKGFPQVVQNLLGDNVAGLKFAPVQKAATPEEAAERAASKVAAQLLRHHTNKNARWVRFGFRSTSWVPFQYDLSALSNSSFGDVLQTSLKNNQSQAKQYLDRYASKKILFGVNADKVRDFVREVSSRDLRRQAAEARRSELLRQSDKSVVKSGGSGLIGGGNAGTARRLEGAKIELTEENQAPKTANVTSFAPSKNTPGPKLSNLTEEQQRALDQIRVSLQEKFNSLTAAPSETPLAVRRLLGDLEVNRENLLLAADTLANRLFTFSKTQNSQGKFILGVGLETASQGEIGFDEDFLKLLLQRPDLAEIALFHEAFESITADGKHNKIRELQKELFKEKDEELTHYIRSFNIARLLEGKVAADKQDAFRQQVFNLLKKKEKTEEDLNLLVMHLLEQNLDLSVLNSIFEALNRSNSRGMEALQPTPALLSNLYNEILQFKADAPTKASEIRIQKLLEKLGLGSYGSQDLLKAIQELTRDLRKPESGPMELSRPLEALLGLLGGVVLEGHYNSVESKRAAAEKLAAALAAMTGKTESKDKAQWVMALMDSSPNLTGLRLSPETQLLFTRLQKQKEVWSKVSTFQASSETSYTFGPNLALNKKGSALALSLGKGASSVEMDLPTLQKKHGLSLKNLAQMQGAFRAAPELSKQALDIRSAAADAMKTSNALAKGERKSLMVVSENMSEQEVRQLAAYFKSVVDAGVTQHHKLIGSRDSFLLQVKELGLFTDTFTQTKLSELFVEAVTPDFTEDKPLIVIGRTGLEAFAGLKKTIVLNSQDSLSAALVGATAFLSQDKTLIQKLQATLSAPNADLTRLSDTLGDSEVNKLVAALTLRIPPIAPLLEFALARLSDEEETVLISG